MAQGCKMQPNVVGPDEQEAVVGGLEARIRRAKPNQLCSGGSSLVSAITAERKGRR